MIKCGQQSATNHLTNGAVHIPPMIIYICILFVCLFIYLTTSMSTNYMARYYANSFTCVISFWGCSMPSLPLAPELYVILPYFMHISLRIMKIIAHVNCLYK